MHNGNITPDQIKTWDQIRTEAWNLQMWRHTNTQLIVSWIINGINSVLTFLPTSTVADETSINIPTTQAYCETYCCSNVALYSCGEEIKLRMKEITVFMRWWYELRYIYFLHTWINKLFSEENDDRRTLFAARKVAGSATCKQSKTVWNFVVLSGQFVEDKEMFVFTHCFFFFFFGITNLD